MDKLDVSIIRELAQAGMVLPARSGMEPSYREVSRKLGIRPGTVRNRIKSMYDAGVLLGSSVYPNPNLLGLSVYSYATDVSPKLSKEKVVERLESIKGMLFIQNFHGSQLGLVFVSEDERTSLEMVASINELTEVTDGIVTRVFYPPCSANFNKEELRLVKRLTCGRFESYHALAKELQTSLRSVKRRVSKIAATRAILSVPTMDYRQIDGVVPADLIVTYASQKQKIKTEMEILDLVEDYTIFAGLWETFSLYSMMIPKVGAATEIVESVKRMEGVKSARLEFVDEHIDLVKTLAEFL